MVAQLIECQTAVLKFRGLINIGIPNFGDHLLGREPRFPEPATDVEALCRSQQRRRKYCSEGTEITAVKAGGGMRCYSAEMVSVDVRECGRMHEEMMILMSMEGRSWQSPTPKQQLPRTEIMGKPSTHKVV